MIPLTDHAVVPVALDLQGPDSGLFERFMVLMKEILLDFACGAAEKALVRIVETAMKFGSETTKCAIERA